MTTNRAPAAEQPPARELPGRAELLYQSVRTRVSRVHPDPDRPGVIRKEPLGAAALHRVRHETAILDRLAGLPGVPQLAEMPADPTAIFLVDSGGATLGDTMDAPLAVPVLLKVAVGLSNVVAAMHRRGVMHKDINPANIVVSADSEPMLIDFDLATTFAEERPSFAHQSEIAGTLAYLAPEQTGRTGRPVDQRADLYALGATLYALATGAPPFGSGDPMQLVHDHLARVPVPPSTVNPAVPAGLCAVILRLLEKEPDRRYQSAEGLAHDLAQLLARWDAGSTAPLVLCERDFPLRLAPLSRLVGRSAEIDSLHTAVEDARQGRGRGLLVTGAPGTGKTALIDELRPIVTAAGGWFVTGKFDQFRGDTQFDAVAQAMRALGRLLLAEPEAELAAMRTRLQRAVGGNAALIASLLPEFALLLDVDPQAAAGEAADAEGRLARAALDVLRAVASPRRPLVMVIDDLQWATATPIGFVDAVLTDRSLAGLLLVGAYRDEEVDAAHPLTATITRWSRLGVAPPRLQLANLPPGDLGTLLGDMLRLPAGSAARLAEAVGERTGGNPFDTVELVNALRRDGALVLGDDGWRWDATTLRRYVGDGDVVDLLIARIDALPAPAQAVLELMACLGGELDTDLLLAATGLAAAELEARLAPSLEDGLLVTESGDRTGRGAIRFRHDRVQQAAYRRRDAAAVRAVHLGLGRRLAAVPGFTATAAQQYLPAIDAVVEPAERHQVAELLRNAAAGLSLTNYNAAERFLAAAASRLAGLDSPVTVRLASTVDIERHAALYRLARLAEADELYRDIERRGLDPVELAAPACVQISSLTNRGLATEALRLGLDLLGRLDLPMPAEQDLGADIEPGLDALYRWVQSCDLAADLRRPDLSDPHLVAAARLISRMMPPAFFSDHTTMAWLVTKARWLWAEHGPSAALVGPLGHAGLVMIGLREDYRTGHGAVSHVLAVSEARGYEPEASVARFLFSVTVGHWFARIEDNIAVAQRAHEGLVQGGDLHFAGFTFHTTTPQTMDCAPTLEAYTTEVDTGLAFAARTGNDQTTECSLQFQWFVQALRGEPGESTDVSVDEADYLAGLAGNPMARAYFHLTRAVAAAIFGRTADLGRHSAAVMSLRPFIQGAYPIAVGYVLRSLALVDAARAAAGAERAALLGELDGCRDWLARGAADCPANFAHLLELVHAERASVVGDAWAATQAYDAALHLAADRQRPWHRALIAERAGAFQVEIGGLRDTGRRLLVEASRLYQAWGATAKVRDLERRYGLPRTGEQGPYGELTQRPATVTSDAIDLVAVLRASQALSSETNLDRLRARVVQVLQAMTGATAVRLVLWEESRDDWLLVPDGDGEDTGVAVTVEQAATLGLLPLTAFQYARRTRTPLVVEDATRDDRFARDPYLSDVDCCSLLVVPILVRGVLRAVLVLENRLAFGAFSADRLDTVLLIVGQLAVSLDNAMVYASLEQKVAERTEALGEANKQLELLSITDPLTGLANRRHLVAALEAEWTRAQRTRSSVAVAMIDIDHFKPYNDHYGHPAGDACLRLVAEALLGTVRTGDLLARYGGEEFILVMPGADVGTAARVAERLRRAVVALDQLHAPAPDGVVTVSIGVAATLPTGESPPAQLVAAADECLYEAKRTGRNRVVGGPDAPPDTSPDTLPGATRRPCQRTASR